MGKRNGHLNIGMTAMGGGGTDGGCADAQTIAQSHLKDVRARQRDLARMARALEGLVASCEGGAGPDCAILDALSG